MKELILRKRKREGKYVVSNLGANTSTISFKTQNRDQVTKAEADFGTSWSGSSAAQ